MFRWGQLVRAPAGVRLEEISDTEVDVAEAAVLNLEAARVRKLVRSLPQPDRRVIEWRYGLGCEPLSCAEVAKKLGVAKSVAWGIEQRALDRLRPYYGLSQDLAA